MKYLLQLNLYWTWAKEHNLWILLINVFAECMSGRFLDLIFLVTWQKQKIQSDAHTTIS